MPGKLYKIIKSNFLSKSNKRFNKTLKKYGNRVLYKEKLS